MTLTENINEQIKTAMKAKNEVGLRALRAIKSAILLAKTEHGSDEIDEETGNKILQKLAKQRRESLDIYEKQNRPDLAIGEKQELAVIEGFLPAQMGEAEIKAIIQKIIADNNLAGAASVGKLMPLAMKELSGKADGKTISAIAKELLA